MLDHHVLMEILREKLKDNRFLRLIENMLKAGYLEDWRWNITHSGAPQGGVISPLIMNVALHGMETAAGVWYSATGTTGRNCPVVVRYADDLLVVCRNRGQAQAALAAEVPLDHIRPDLAESRERHRTGLDAGRPEVTERRHATGRRTARENIADLVDEGSFTEYGAMVIAAQRRRRSLDDLIARTPADGLVLSRKLADRGHFPALDVAASVSRVMPAVVAPEQVLQAQRFKQLYNRFEESRDMIAIGGYRPGNDLELDRAVQLQMPMNAFLVQDMTSAVGFDDSVATLREIVA